MGLQSRPTELLQNGSIGSVLFFYRSVKQTLGSSQNLPEALEPPLLRVVVPPPLELLEEDGGS